MSYNETLLNKGKTNICAYLCLFIYLFFDMHLYEIVLSNFCVLCIRK